LARQLKQVKQAKAGKTNANESAGEHKSFKCENQLKHNAAIRMSVCLRWENNQINGSAVKKR